MRILVVTDSHLAAHASAFADNWRHVAGFAERSRADLTIHLGDITLDAINATPQLDEAKAMIEGWPTPMRLIPGNHDLGDNPGTIGVPEREWLTDASRQRYLERFGDDWWRFESDGWTIVAIDAQLLGSDLPAETDQWTWLEATLAATSGPVLLALHKPLFERRETDRDHSPRLVPFGARDRLLDCVARHDVRLVLCGHAHQHLDRMIADVRHVWLPSCAFIIPDPHQRRVGEKVVGVGLLDLMPDDYRFGIVLPEGVVRHDISDFPGLTQP